MTRTLHHHTIAERPPIRGTSAGACLGAIAILAVCWAFLLLVLFNWWRWLRA